MHQLLKSIFILTTKLVPVKITKIKEKIAHDSIFTCHEQNEPATAAAYCHN